MVNQNDLNAIITQFTFPAFSNTLPASACTVIEYFISSTPDTITPITDLNIDSIARTVTPTDKSLIKKYEFYVLASVVG